MTTASLRHAALVLARDVAERRRLLVVSPRRGDGRTFTASRLVAELEAVGVRATLVHIDELGEASSSRPAARRGAALEIVDGPALLDDGDAGPRLTPARVRAVDGALLVVRGQTASRADVKETSERLKAIGLTTLGVVWNGREDPKVADVAADLRALRRAPLALWALLRRLPRAFRQEIQRVG